MICQFKASGKSGDNYAGWRNNTVLG